LLLPILSTSQSHHIFTMPPKNTDKGKLFEGGERIGFMRRITRRSTGRTGLLFPRRGGASSRSNKEECHPKRSKKVSASCLLVGKWNGDDNSTDISSQQSDFDMSTLASTDHLVSRFSGADMSFVGSGQPSVCTSSQGRSKAVTFDDNVIFSRALKEPNSKKKTAVPKRKQFVDTSRNYSLSSNYAAAL
jgi:hypothetical protein